VEYSPLEYTLISFPGRRILSNMEDNARQGSHMESPSFPAETGAPTTPAAQFWAIGSVLGQLKRSERFLFIVLSRLSSPSRHLPSRHHSSEYEQCA
jgi:hypothetical protein